MSRAQTLPWLLPTILALALPCPGRAQEETREDGVSPRSRTPAIDLRPAPIPSVLDPWSPAPWATVGTIGRPTQEAPPLHATDHLGNPITSEEIGSRMRSAGHGPVLGGVLGGLVGGAIGIAIAWDLCPIEIFGSGCSPRDDALATVAALAGIGWGATLGSIVGRNRREIDKWEALELIREERRRSESGS